MQNQIDYQRWRDTVQQRIRYQILSYGDIPVRHIMPSSTPFYIGQDSELWFERVIVARIYKHSFAQLRTQICAKGCHLHDFMSSLWCWTEGRRRVMSQRWG